MCRETNMRLCLSRLESDIEVPEITLIHRDNLANMPPDVWPSKEVLAYGVRRFDRANDRELIHIEDLAQVRNIYPYNDKKYQGSFEL